MLDIVILGLLGCAAAAALVGYPWSARPPTVALTTQGPSAAETGTATPALHGAATRAPNRPTSRPTASRAVDPLRRSIPVELQIPAIGLHTRLVRLDLASDGALQVPTDFAVAGWYTLGPTPGEIGPAVIAGHIDSYRGPAVFFRLSALRPGDQVRVAEQDGQVALFRVYAIAQYPKTAFPTDKIYANTDSPELRLITCGGTFDTHLRSYRDNVVVYATLVTAQPASKEPVDRSGPDAD